MATDIYGRNMMDPDQQPARLFSPDGTLNTPRQQVGMADFMRKPVDRSRDPNLVGLALTGAKATGQDIPIPAGFELAGTSAKRELDYQLRSARENRIESRRADMVGSGVDPNVAAKLAADQLMLRPDQPTRTKPEVYSTANGLFQRSDKGTLDLVPGTAPAVAAAQRTTPPPDIDGDGTPDPVVQRAGFYGTWNPRMGEYDAWNPFDRGETVETTADGMRIQRGGGDYSRLPEYKPAAPAAAAAPAADPDVEQPPYEGARKAPDGNWYVMQDGKWFRVES